MFAYTIVYLYFVHVKVYVIACTLPCTVYIGMHQLLQSDLIAFEIKLQNRITEKLLLLFTIKAPKGLMVFGEK